MHSFKTGKREISEQEQAVSDYLETIGVKVFISFVGSKTEKQDSEGWAHDEWYVTFQRGESGRDSLGLPYRTGVGHRRANERVPDYVRINPRSIATENWMKWHVKPETPHVAGPLYSLVVDSSVAEYLTYEDWAVEYGYEQDSRKGQAVYDSCREQTAEYFRFFSAQERLKIVVLLEDY